MKPSVANKDDSVFVLFTAHSKNNIVKALLYEPEAARSKKTGRGFYSLFPIPPREQACRG